MPIYEYCCDKCSHRFELKQRFTDEPVASCPRCKSKTRRVFSPAPIIFKGSGFYVTDVKQKEASYKGHEASSKKPDSESYKKPEVDSPKESPKETAKPA